MTNIKLCGLKRQYDIEYVNDLHPEYIGFVFAKNSKRYISPQNAKILKNNLDNNIIAVGVFVNEEIDTIIELVKNNIIDAVQLHGDEDNNYINTLRKFIDCKIIKAFKIKSKEDIFTANNSSADYILLDSGAGSGETFDWSIINEIKREYFLAGGLTSENVEKAITEFKPFAVDASSSLETNGFKDKEKMIAFINAVRERKD